MGGPGVSAKGKLQYTSDAAPTTVVTVARAVES